MLPKPKRLHKSGQYKVVFKQGKSFVTKFFAAYVMKADTVKVGFIASKKVGNAVRRNRAKRLLREAVRCQLPTLDNGFHMIVIARKPASTAVFSDIQKSLCYVVRKAGLT
jgi:ribonuclease P protein component